jgi:hypothetical protein
MDGGLLQCASCERMTAPDATVGFLATFRQFNTPDERASFKRARTTGTLSPSEL